jgi:hypothetical protein
MAMTRESVIADIARMKADIAEQRGVYETHVEQCAQCLTGAHCPLGAFRLCEWQAERRDFRVYVRRATFAVR